MCMAWCEVKCGHAIVWSDLMWIMVRCEMWCDVYLKCGAMWNVAISDMVWCGTTEMQNVWCGIWHGVECGVLVCGKLLCELWWCRIVTMKNVAYAMCGVIVVWCQMWKMMHVLWCQMWCYVKRCGGVMWCGIWCGMKCAEMLNVGVVWNSCGRGMVWDVDCVCVMWNMLCFEVSVVVWNGGVRQTAV